MHFASMTRTSMRFGASLAVVVLMGTFISVAAEQGDTEKKITELETRIAELEAALKTLQAGSSVYGPSDAIELRRRLDLLAAEIASIQLGEAAARRDLKPVHGLGPGASRVYGAAKGVSIGGYGEALYEDFKARDDSGGPSGKIDRFDFLRGVLYAGYKFSDRIIFNSEIEFEHASTGKGGEVSLEFAYLDFLLNEHANVRAGMVLVPAGFINELHEPPVFLGARRPDVERRILPATWRENGVGVFGDAGPFTYRAYILAGLDSAGFSAADAVRGGRQSGAQSKAEDLAFTARMDFTGVPGLLAGVFFYHGEADQGRLAPIGVDPNGLPTGLETMDAAVTVHDFHAEYRARGLDLRALYAEGRINDSKSVNDAGSLTGSGSIAERFFGWYAQAGWDVLSLRPASAQSLTPFVRHEAFNTQDRVSSHTPRTGAPFSANPANDVRILTYGIVYKPVFNVSIKVDWQNFRNEANSGVDQFSLSIGYLF